MWNDEEEAELEDQINGELSRAVRDAEAAPPIDPKSMIMDVFAQLDPRTLSQFEDEIG